MPLYDWLNLLLRWLHIFSGILWIGQTWLFMWLDRRLEDALENPGGQLFMVHSGGFYVVEKKLGLATMPKTLHWFKWEAALTWATGIALLVVVYYLGGLLLEPDAEIGQGTAIAIGIGVLALSWLAYDALVRVAPARVVGPVGFLLIVGLAWALGKVFSARAAYIHVGAALGTIMASNVWLRILPGQQAMVAAIRAGLAPDLALGARAKERSKHNTFIVVPLVMIMVSNHFPTLTYAHDQPWAMLGALTLLGWAAAWLYRRST